MLEIYNLLKNITKDDVINQASMFDFILLQKLLDKLRDDYLLIKKFYA